jgi:hypothetical protein
LRSMLCECIYLACTIPCEIWGFLEAMHGHVCVYAHACVWDRAGTPGRGQSRESAKHTKQTVCFCAFIQTLQNNRPDDISLQFVHGLFKQSSGRSDTISHDSNETDAREIRQIPDTDPLIDN